MSDPSLPAQFPCNFVHVLCQRPNPQHAQMSAVSNYEFAANGQQLSSWRVAHGTQRMVQGSGLRHLSTRIATNHEQTSGRRP